MRTPSYFRLYASGELRERAEQLRAMLTDCTVCPRECRVNRVAGRIGKCRSTAEVVISSVSPHFGEEPPLVGYGGSGTIFFTNCNLCCLFCQNYDISHLKRGRPVTKDELAGAMLQLQRVGCHNINLVTPTHYAPQIVEAFLTAVEKGLSIPIVYNCGGYESVETLRLLDGIVDIYMPDIKYSNDEHARRYSGVKDYWRVVQAAIREMHRQVGDLTVNKDGIAERGLLIRHLILPNRIAGSEKVLQFISQAISRESYVNIMDQYRPCFKADKLPELNRVIRSQEFHEVIALAQRLGLKRRS